MASIAVVATGPRSWLSTPGWVLAVAVTLDGRRAVSGSGKKTLRVWDLRLRKTERCGRSREKSDAFL
jgi:hypothetical protein